jgi:transaldolase
MNKLKKLKIEIFADGANLNDIKKLNKNKMIKGFTTNPSLMRKDGVKNYSKFAKDLLKNIKKPISFEVFADTEKEIIKQALSISSWGENVYVKIPILYTSGASTKKVIHILSNKYKIKLNLTAIFTKIQIKEAIENLDPNSKSIISIFAGRITDTGIDTNQMFSYANKIKKLKKSKVKVLWASTREVYNIFQANKIGANIITVPSNILNKLNKISFNLNKYSIETAKEFYRDAKKSGFRV